MKQIRVIAFAVFIAAGTAGLSAYSQSIGGGGSGGGLISRRLFAPNSTKCLEGSSMLVTVYDQNGRSFQEPRVCRGGTFMSDDERKAYIPQPRGCSEGQRGSVSMQNQWGYVYDEPRICHNGTYMTIEEQKNYTRDVSKPCIDGTYGKATVVNQRTGSLMSVQVFCSGHRWTQIP